MNLKALLLFSLNNTTNWKKWATFTPLSVSTVVLGISSISGVGTSMRTSGPGFEVRYKLNCWVRRGNKRFRWEYIALKRVSGRRRTDAILINYTGVTSTSFSVAAPALHARVFIFSVLTWRVVNKLTTLTALGRQKWWAYSSRNGIPMCSVLFHCNSVSGSVGSASISLALKLTAYAGTYERDQS